MSAVIKQDFSSNSCSQGINAISLTATDPAALSSNPKITQISSNSSYLSWLKNKVVKGIEPIAYYIFPSKSSYEESKDSLSQKSLKQITLKTEVDNNTKAKEPLTLNPYDNLVQYLPGMSNLIYAPIEFFKGLIISGDNYKKNDSETSLDSKLRILQALISFFHALGSSFMNFTTFFSLIISKISVSSLISSSVAKVTFILGLLVTCIEGIIEILGLVRSVIFSTKPIFSIPKFLTKLKKRPTIFHQKKITKEFIQYLNKNRKWLNKNFGYSDASNLIETLLSYQNDLSFHASRVDVEKLEAKLLYLCLDNFKKTQIEPSEEMVEKITGSTQIPRDNAKDIAKQLNLENLSKRIHLFAALKVKDDLDSILTSLGSIDPIIRKKAIDEAKKLAELMKTQNTKKILVHIIGLIAITLTLIGLILSTILVFHPLFLPVILGLVLPEVLFWSGFALSIVHFCLNRGFMGCEGWHFSIKKTLPDPDWFKSAFQNLKRRFTRKPKPIKFHDISSLTPEEIST